MCVLCVYCFSEPAKELLHYFSVLVCTLHYGSVKAVCSYRVYLLNLVLFCVYFPEVYVRSFCRMYVHATLTFMEL